MTTIRLAAIPYVPDQTENIGSDLTIRLPDTESAKLPSRGTVMTEGNVGGIKFWAALEPDGKGSHWLQFKKSFSKAAGLSESSAVQLELTPTKVWPEPKLPSDLEVALAADAQAKAQWQTVTPMARWEWIRWLENVKLLDTRKERPAKLCSMLRSGKRRPCCFNRAMRTPPKYAVEVN